MIKNLKANDTFKDFSNALQVAQDSMQPLIADIETISSQLSVAKGEKSSLTNQISLSCFVAVIVAGIEAFDEKFPKDIFKRSQDADKCGTYHAFYGAYSKARLVADYLLCGNELNLGDQGTLNIDSVNQLDTLDIKPISTLYQIMHDQIKSVNEANEQEQRTLEHNLMIAIRAASDGEELPGLTPDQNQALVNSDIDTLKDSYGKLGLVQFANGGHLYAEKQAELAYANEQADLRLALIEELIVDLQKGQAYLPDTMMIALAQAVKTAVKTITAPVQQKVA